MGVKHASTRLLSLTRSLSKQVGLASLCVEHGRASQTGSAQQLISEHNLTSAVEKDEV